MSPKDLTRHLSKISKAKPQRVRAELLDSGVALAFAGYPRAAVTLFERAAEAPKHPHESVYYEGAVAGLRVALGLDKSAATKRAAAEADKRTRGDLLVDRWPDMKTPPAKKGTPPAKLTNLQIIEWFRRAILERDDGRRLEILKSLVARPDLLRYFRDDAMLLVADGLARAGDAGAGAALAAWVAAEGSFPEQALALQPLAKLLASAGPSGSIKPKDVNDFVKQATAAAAKGVKAERAASKHEVTTLYNQFYLEPKKPRNKKVYFQGPGDVAAGYSLLGDKVGLTTPAEAGACAVTLKVAPAPARLPAGAKVVKFPFKVTGDLYLRSVSDVGDDNRYAVPPGTYHVTVAFKRRRTDYDVDVYLAPTS